MELGDYSAWIGRQDRRTDIVTAGPAARLAAMLDHDTPDFAAGAPMQPMAHWLFFLPQEPQSTLGPDGHARRGGFLPPVHELPRRMWAGGRFTFHAPLRAGMAVERVSTIASVEAKQGKSGPLVFVTVRHDVREQGGDLLVSEDHDIVYRGLGGPAVTSAQPFASAHVWEQTLVPDAVMLFRFSALTFNGHRIHYDRDYVTGTEGYPGLIVHGPMVAMMLLDLARLNRPDLPITRFSFRALAPMFDGRALTLKGHPDAEAPGTALLWAENDSGGRTMVAEAEFAAATV